MKTIELNSKRCSYSELLLSQRESKEGLPYFLDAQEIFTTLIEPMLDSYLKQDFIPHLQRYQQLRLYLMGFCLQDLYVQRSFPKFVIENMLGLSCLDWHLRKWDLHQT